MNKQIEVTLVQIPVDGLFADPELYPSRSGLYCAVGENWTPQLMEKVNGKMKYLELGDSLEGFVSEPIVEAPPMPEPQQPQPQGLTENTLLKAIAIVQKPELALNLVGDKGEDG